MTTAAMVQAHHVLPRVPARCRHFGVCGGCSWQDVDYAAQAAMKQALVADHLRAVAPPQMLRPIIAAPSPWYYRSKMEFTFAPPALLGLHARGRWRQIVNLEECFLQSPLSAALVRDVRAYVAESGWSCFDPHTHQGLLRSLVIREARGTGEVMLGVVTKPGRWPGGEGLAQTLVRRYPQITSIVRGIVAPQTMEVTEIELLAGREHIVERLGGLQFRIGLTTFFQANTAQAEGMLAIVDEFAALDGSSRAVDLYCGIGTFALALARRAGEVIGIDTSEPAIEAARENAAINGSRNTEFYAADARALPVLAAGPRVDVLVLDPPRAGVGPKVIRQIAALAPARVVYVSCQPATLASDLRGLVAAGYAVSAVQAVDQFPHTPHVECVVQLHREAIA